MLVGVPSYVAVLEKLKSAALGLQASSVQSALQALNSVTAVGGAPWAPVLADTLVKASRPAVLTVAGGGRHAVAGQAVRLARRTVAARLFAKVLQRRAMSAALSQPVKAGVGQLSSTALSGLGVPRPLALGIVSLVAEQLVHDRLSLPKLDLPRLGLPHVVVDVPTNLQLTVGSHSTVGSVARWVSLLLLLLGSLVMFAESLRRKWTSQISDPRYATDNPFDAFEVMETPSQTAAMRPPPVKSAAKRVPSVEGPSESKGGALFARRKSVTEHVHEWDSATTSPKPVTAVAQAAHACLGAMLPKDAQGQTQRFPMTPPASPSATGKPPSTFQVELPKSREELRAEKKAHKEQRRLSRAIYSTQISQYARLLREVDDDDELHSDSDTHSNSSLNSSFSAPSLQPTSDSNASGGASFFGLDGRAKSLGGGTPPLSPILSPSIAPSSPWDKIARIRAHKVMSKLQHVRSWRPSMDFGSAGEIRRGDDSTSSSAPPKRSSKSLSRVSRTESFVRSRSVHKSSALAAPPPISRGESFARRAQSFLKEAHALTRSRTSISATEPSPRLGDLAVIATDETSTAVDEPTARSSAARELDLLLTQGLRT